jgi:hypothetical protein
MLRKIRLRTKLLGSFILIGIIVLIIGYIGWHSNTELIEEMLGINSHLESSIGLSEVNNVFMRIAISQQLLINPWLTREMKHRERINVDIRSVL